MNKVITMLSATPVTQSVLETVSAKFPELEKSDVMNQLDPTLIAGVTILDGSTMIDLSLSRALHNLQEYLYETC